MQGHNSQTQAAFLKSITNSRKRQLAEMLLAGEGMKAVNEAGFNDVIAKEMARAIRTNVQGAEYFTIDPKEPVNTEKPGDQTPGDQLQADQNATQNDTPQTTSTEGNDTVDQNPTVESGVPTAPVDPTTATPVAEQSTPDQTVPQS